MHAEDAFENEETRASKLESKVLERYGPYILWTSIILNNFFQKVLTFADLIKISNHIRAIYKIEHKALYDRRKNLILYWIYINWSKISPNLMIIKRQIGRMLIGDKRKSKKLINTCINNNDFIQTQPMMQMIQQNDAFQTSVLNPNTMEQQLQIQQQQQSTHFDMSTQNSADENNVSQQSISSSDHTCINYQPVQEIEPDDQYDNNPTISEEDDVQVSENTDYHLYGNDDEDIEFTFESVNDIGNNYII